MDSPYPSPFPLSGKSFFRKPLVEIGGMPHPLTESPLSISVLTIKDFEFGTLPWHLVIRVKFGISVQNWDFPGIINAKVYKCKDTRCGTKGTVEGSSAGSLSGIQAKTSRYLTKSTAVSLLLGSSKWTSLSCSSPSQQGICIQNFRSAGDEVCQVRQGCAQSTQLHFFGIESGTSRKGSQSHPGC